MAAQKAEVRSLHAGKSAQNSHFEGYISRGWRSGLGGRKGTRVSKAPEFLTAAQENLRNWLFARFYRKFFCRISLNFIVLNILGWTDIWVSAFAPGTHFPKPRIPWKLPQIRKGRGRGSGRGQIPFCSMRLKCKRYFVTLDEGSVIINMGSAPEIFK